MGFAMRATSHTIRWTAFLCLALAGGIPGLSAAAAEPPVVQREFRAAWITTVANIDWPSRPGLPPDQQRAELTALLDRAVATGLNAVILQIRPSADALYDSPLEPWSEYLTGTMGKARVRPTTRSPSPSTRLTPAGSNSTSGSTPTASGMRMPPSPWLRTTRVWR
jgi:uncharacterized lipoprotein YddW (UPF0748 family)